MDEKDWQGVRRKYWFGRETYYLPIITWKKSLDVKVKAKQSMNNEEEGGDNTEMGVKKRKIEPDK